MLIKILIISVLFSIVYSQINVLPARRSWSHYRKAKEGKKGFIKLVILFSF